MVEYNCFDDGGMWKSFDVEMSLVWMVFWEELVYNLLSRRMIGRRLSL